MINATVTGRLGKDAEIKYTATGTMMLAFTVASDAGWGDNKHTNWVNCTMFGNRAEKLAPYLKKGTSVAVFGELDKREWESNGKSGSSLDVTVDRLDFMGTKAQQETTNAGSQYRETKVVDAPQSRQPFDDDDLPF